MGSQTFDSKKEALDIWVKLESMLSSNNYEYVGTHKGWDLYINREVGFKARVAIYYDKSKEPKGGSIFNKRRT
jgi:hypothetical protein